MTEYPEGEDPNQMAAQNVDQLSHENRKNASQLIDAFGEEVVAKLFSKTWQTREDALNQIEDLTVNSNQMSQEEAFVSGVGAAYFTIQDKMAGVGQKSMYLLSGLCNSYPHVTVSGGQKS